MGKYHMRRIERQITDEQELRELVKKGKYTVIALCRDNEPYIVTLSYGYDEEANALYFHTGKEGLKLDFIRANPAVCATVIEDRGYIMNECEHAYSSAVLWGTMSEVTELEEKKHGMSVLFRHLEEMPDAMRERFFESDEVYNGVNVLKLEISEMTGKKGK